MATRDSSLVGPAVAFKGLSWKRNVQSYARNSARFVVRGTEQCHFSSWITRFWPWLKSGVYGDAKCFQYPTHDGKATSPEDSDLGQRVRNALRSNPPVFSMCLSAS